MSEKCQDLLCPCCNASGEPFEQYGNRISYSYRNGSSMLCECKSCGHLFFDPPPSEPALKQFYEHEYAAASRHYYTIDNDYAAGKNAPLVALIHRALRDHVGQDPRGLRVHDVGCAFGGLVHALRAEGFDATGSDLNEEAISLGRDRGNSHVFCAPVCEHLQNSGERYHLFWLNHVLEHLREPLRLLRELHSLLEKTGVLMLHVPSGLFAPARRSSVLQNNWFGYPMHPHMFSPGSICKALEACGFRVISLECTSTEEQLDWFLDTLVGVQNCDIPHAGKLVEAIAANYLGREIRAIACRDDSPIPTRFDTTRLPRLVRPWRRPRHPGVLGCFEDGRTSHGQHVSHREPSRGGGEWQFHWGKRPPRIDGGMSLNTDGLHWWEGPEKHCIIGQPVMHPGARTSPILVWTSSKNAVVDVSANFSLVDARSAGVRVQIAVNDKVLLEHDVGFGADFDVEKYLQIEAGTKVSFAVSCIRGNNAHCSTRALISVQELAIEDLSLPAPGSSVISKIKRRLIG